MSVDEVEIINELEDIKDIEKLTTAENKKAVIRKVNYGKNNKGGLHNVIKKPGKK